MVRRQLRWRGLRFGRGRNEHRIVEQIEADAVARGPLLALELDADLENAERLLAAGDVSCTAEFARVADVLEGRGHLPHAAIVRRREAKARDTFGDVDTAARCRADLAWKHLELMQPWEAGFALHDGQIAGRGEELSATAQRIVALAQAAVDAAKGYALDDLVAAFDAAEDDDPFRERAAAHLCEQAVADEQPDLVLGRRASLSSIAQQAAATSDSSLRRLGARIDMCLADVTGEWPPLLMRAHRIHDPFVIAWMHARYGRWAALNSDGATAQHHYLLAIERACAGDMYQEAADWLYAWRTVRFWYGDFGPDEQHALAQALRVHPAAQTNKLPGSQHTPESALRALHADKPNEALERIRRWIWQAVVRAELTYEVEAVTALGDLVRTKQLDVEAVECYVRAGDAKAARAAADAIADKPVDLSTELLRPLGASRAAAYRGITGCADLLTDDRAGTWVEAALAEIDGLAEPRRAPLDPAVEAFGTLAALADTLTCSQAVQLITLTESLLDRPANRHLETDDASVQIMTELARHHPCVGDRSVRGLLHALLLNDRLADKVLDARDVLQANRQIVGDMLAEPAAQDHHQACLALVVADADGTPALHHARQRVDQLVAPGRTQPYIVTMSAEPRDAAILVRLLSPEQRNDFARTMIERALNRSSPTASRRSDLVALTYIATHLDDDVRTALFTVAMEIARGEHAVEELELADQNPFSIAQIQMPPTNLGVDGLRCAAALAGRVEQFSMVEQIAIELLGPSHPDRAWTIATILYDLPGEHSRLELPQLAVHPSAALRALAAARWPRNAGSLPLRTARALATDANQRVRYEVALAVMAPHAEATAEPVQIIRQMLAGDVRRSIRKIVAPAEAAATCATALRRPKGEG